jgi:hypothetical protein
MATLIGVIRKEPPEIGQCSDTSCRRAIEWVETVRSGRRMPVDHPLTVERVEPRLDGPPVTIIDGGSSHFATCPAAQAFRRSPRVRR